jgi:hypothetical protein
MVENWWFRGTNIFSWKYIKILCTFCFLKFSRLLMESHMYIITILDAQQLIVLLFSNTPIM